MRYLLEELFTSQLFVKIDRFALDSIEQKILVIYRIGKKKLTQKLPLSDFSNKYFDNLSTFDRQRITKFSTLQDLLINLFINDISSKPIFINHLKNAIKNDQLF